MAKIFSTEKLSLNGDNIRIQSTGAGIFEITNSDSTSVLISRNSIETAHSSLHVQDVDYASSLTAVDVAGNSSLNAQDIEFASSLTAVDVAGNSSLNAQDIDDASSLNAQDIDDASSLNAQDISNTSSLMAEINATNNSIESNDVVAISDTLGSGIESKTVSFNRDFTSVPSVSVTLFNNSGDPIIGTMVSSITTGECTVVFSDNLPSANYELKILASI